MLSVEHLSSLLVECKNMCQKLQNAIDTINGSYETTDVPKNVTFKYKSSLKLTPEKNKIYIKFHNKCEVTDTALNDDTTCIQIQHSGYDLDVHDPNTQFEPDTWTICQRVSPDSNVYVAHLDIKPMITAEYPKTESIVRLRGDIHATFDYVIIRISGIVNPNINFVTFSTEKLI